MMTISDKECNSITTGNPKLGFESKGKRVYRLRKEYMVDTIIIY